MPICFLGCKIITSVITGSWKALTLFYNTCTLQSSPVPHPPKHGTGSFCGTFNVQLSRMNSSLSMGLWWRWFSTYVLHIDTHHNTTLLRLFKCLDQSIQFKPTEVEKEGVSGRAGTRALAFALPFCVSVQSTMSTSEI